MRGRSPRRQSVDAHQLPGCVSTTSAEGEPRAHLRHRGLRLVRLTVTDIDRSRDFYDNVFGFGFDIAVAVEMAADADENTQQALWFVFGGVIYHFPGGLLGLRPAAHSDDAFHPHRGGLDHLSFTVANVDALHAAATVLDDLGVPHRGVQIDSGFRLLEFYDPDGIALELSCQA